MTPEEHDRAVGRLRCEAERVARRLRGMGHYLIAESLAAVEQTWAPDAQDDMGEFLEWALRELAASLDAHALAAWNPPATAEPEALARWQAARARSADGSVA